MQLHSKIFKEEKNIYHKKQSQIDYQKLQLIKKTFPNDPKKTYPSSIR